MVVVFLKMDISQPRYVLSFFFFATKYCLTFRVAEEEMEYLLYTSEIGLGWARIPAFYATRPWSFFPLVFRLPSSACFGSQ